MREKAIGSGKMVPMASRKSHFYFSKRTSKVVSPLPARTEKNCKFRDPMSNSPSIVEFGYSPAQAAAK